MTENEASESIHEGLVGVFFKKGDRPADVGHYPDQLMEQACKILWNGGRQLSSEKESCCLMPVP